MAPGEQFIKETFQHHHLSARVDEVFIDDGLPGAFVHRPIEQERMGADFSKLHDSILQFHVIDLLGWNETTSLARYRARDVKHTLGLQLVFAAKFRQIFLLLPLCLLLQLP